MLGGGEDVAHRELRRLALMRLAVARALVVLIRLEDLLQPGHQLIDRRQRARWPRLAARSLRTGLALRSRLAVGARLAALAIGPATAWLPLGTTRTRRSLRAAPGRIFCH